MHSSYSFARNRFARHTIRAVIAPFLLLFLSVPYSSAPQFDAAIFGHVRPAIIRITCPGSTEPPPHFFGRRVIQPSPPCMQSLDARQ